MYVCMYVCIVISLLSFNEQVNKQIYSWCSSGWLRTLTFWVSI